MPITLTGTDLDGQPVTYGLLSSADPRRHHGHAAQPHLHAGRELQRPRRLHLQGDGPVGRQRHRPPIDITVDPVNDAPTTTERQRQHQRGHPGRRHDRRQRPRRRRPHLHAGVADGQRRDRRLRRRRVHLHAGLRASPAPTRSRSLVADGNGGTATSTVTVNVSAFNNTAPVSTTPRSWSSRTRPGPSASSSADADGDPLHLLGARPAGAGLAHLLDLRRLHLSPPDANVTGDTRPPSSRSTTVGRRRQRHHHARSSSRPTTRRSSCPAQHLVTAEDTPAAFDAGATIRTATP